MRAPRSCLGALCNHHSYSWRSARTTTTVCSRTASGRSGRSRSASGSCRSSQRSPGCSNSRLRALDDRVLVADSVGAVAAFGLYTAVKASYISTQFADPRRGTQLHLSRAARLRRRRARWASPGPNATGAGCPRDCSRRVPARHDAVPRHRALLFRRARARHPPVAEPHDLASPRTTRAACSSASSLGTVVALPPAELARRLGGAPRRIIGLAAGAMLAVLAVGWNLTGEIVAADASNTFATRSAACSPLRRTGSTTPPAVPEPCTWATRSTTDPTAFWSMEFWNQSIQDVWSDGRQRPRPRAR